MRRAPFLILLLCLPLAAVPSSARDLWGSDGIILSLEDTPVLTRTMRMTPETRLRPVTDVEVAAAGEPLPGSPEPSVIDPVDFADTELQTVARPQNAPGTGHVLTAPPIPGRGTHEAAPGAPAAQAATSDGADERDRPYNPQAEDIASSDPGAPDISDVEFFSDSGEEAGAPVTQAPPAQETQVAALHDPAAPVPEDPPRPAPQFNSLAYSGLFTGVGVAEGMRLRLDLSDSELAGNFTDSSGQNFRVDGQLTNMQGRARAVVVSADQPIGFMDFQLTNLGLTALFVPLGEDLAPVPGGARQYEFLRSLSDAARAAIAAERAAREAPAETGSTPQNQSGPLRERFPGDEDGR